MNLVRAHRWRWVKMNPNEIKQDNDGSTSLDRLAVELGSGTHQGHVRENNEDSFLVIRFGRSLERLSTILMRICSSRITA